MNLHLTDDKGRQYDVQVDSVPYRTAEYMITEALPQERVTHVQHEVTITEVVSSFVHTTTPQDDVADVIEGIFSKVQGVINGRD